MKWTHQQVILCYRQQQFDEYAESIVKGTVAIETENPKVDVVARESGFEHREAHNNAFQRTISMLKIKQKTGSYLYTFITDIVTSGHNNAKRKWNKWDFYNTQRYIHRESKKQPLQSCL